MKRETIALHHGYAPDDQHSVAVPIHQTTSFSFDSAQHAADLFDLKVEGNIYSRIMNPTCAVLEQRIAALEGGLAGLAVASGMAAITYAIQTIAEAGDNIVSISELYGGTYNLFAHTLPRQGIEVRFADKDDLDGLEALIDARTKAVFCESVGNPSGSVVDMKALAEVAHRHGVPVIVDNTVPTPFLWRPIEHGADIVMPLALLTLAWLVQVDLSHFLGETRTTLLLIASGVITALPLLAFAGAARRLRLATLGFLMYINPTIQFGIALLVFGEPLTAVQLATFALIWTALALYTWSAWQGRARAAA